MARKKKNSEKQSKADFIRSFPLSVKADDIVAKAAEAGFDKLTKGYVETTRSGMRKEQKQREAVKLAKTAPQENAAGVEIAKLMLAMGPVKARARVNEFLDMAEAVTNVG